MTWEQGTILVVLAGTMAVFVWDRWRYDVVAITSLGVIREGRRLFGRMQAAVLQAGDIMLLQAATATLRRTIEEDQLELVERDKENVPQGAGPDLVEAVVLPNALVQGSSPLSLDLRRRYGINLVAAARQGRRF